MTRHCYDTAVLVDLLRGTEEAKQLVRGHEGEERAATAVTVFELAVGATTPRRQRTALALLETLTLLPLSPATAWTAGETMRELRATGREPPIRDLLVGAIAREAGFILYTFDQRFPGLEGLDLRVV